jgi:predicted ATPase
MVEQPSGTVTFVFTDIEGSTRLLRRLGEERYGEALAAHREIVREAFGARGGYEVNYEGDAFFYAFSSAVDALAAVSDAMAQLESTPVRIRAGVHTGAPELDPPKYLGLDVHLAARVSAAGHGGQVLLTRVTRDLVDAPVLSLGEHRLNDFDGPVTLFQLGKSEFPPLRTISSTNLPHPVSSFVGRAREKEEVLRVFREGSRLVTLSGPGGSGKTRLALEVASELVPELRAGVFWVGLAPLHDTHLVLETIAQAIGAKDGLAEHIGDGEQLLLLDNFEQVVEAAPELGELLQRCPNLRLLVTSRALLRIRGEVEYPVPPLAAQEAVELFCERARLDPSETIAELCRRLDELPLALELAATRTSALSVSQILERLVERLDLLKGGRDVDARQQTLRATIEWSHELLGEEEQTMFRRLAVFRGGCSLDAAETVGGAGLDVLQSLADKSLIRHRDDRFSMLETIREYGRERLAASGEEPRVRRTHALYFRDLVEDVAADVDRLSLEHDNVRAALDWAREEGEGETLLRLVAGVRGFWETRGFYEEMDAWLPLALESGSAPAKARIVILHGAIGRALHTDDFARAVALVEELRALAEQEGDELGILKALNAQGNVSLERGALDDAHEWFSLVAERSRASGIFDWEANATINLAVADGYAGDFQAGLHHAREGVALVREHGDESALSHALAVLGWICLGLSDPAAAVSHLQESLAILVRLGSIPTYVGVEVLSDLATAFVALEEMERGAQLLAASARLRKETATPFETEDSEKSFEDATATARGALGEDAFADAWARGETITLEEIAALAQRP